MSFILPESMTLVENKKKYESYVYALQRDKYINNLGIYVIKKCMK